MLHLVSILFGTIFTEKFLHLYTWNIGHPRVCTVYVTIGAFITVLYMYVYVYIRLCFFCRDSESGSTPVEEVNPVSCV